MEDIVKADIFFFVSTVSLVFITVAFLIALYFVIRILREAAHISRVIKEETEQIRGDVADARMYMREEAIKFRYFMGFLKAFMGGSEKHKEEVKRKRTAKKGNN